MRSKQSTIATLDDVSLGELDAKLRKITEVLARELASPSQEPPAWTDFEWRVARAVSVMQGIAPLLSVQTKWPESTPWHHFIDEQRKQVAGRHNRIETLLSEIHGHARAKGVALLALKGAALHAIGVYSKGERPMADVDLLVRDRDRASAHEILDACNFKLTFVNKRHDLFEPKNKGYVSTEYGEHADNPLKIELHTSIRERLPVREIDITQFLFPVGLQCGICFYRSRVALMMHLLLHAAGNMRAHALRHIQLQDIARLGEYFDAGEWDDLISMRASGQSMWWAFPPLVMVSKYFPAAVPDTALKRLESECTRVLRASARRHRLADVSWSNIRIYALPGIEWCRNPKEAVQFALARIFPDRAIREDLKHFDRQIPDGPKVQWYGISQAARIMRWMISRPPRVQTLMAVRAALDQKPNLDRPETGA
jgi:hypothetical protein